MSGYQPPLQSGASTGTSFATPDASAQFGGGPQSSAAKTSSDGSEMEYTCGDCGLTLAYRLRTLTRCRECGGRVLYKLRTKRMIQFEAR